MIKNRILLLATLVVGLSTHRLLAQADALATRRDPQPQIRYQLGADSLPQEGVPKGKLEGPFLFQSQILENTVRKYWVFVPAQYSAAEPACVLVFQDGARAINPNGVLRVDQVLENLIAKKQIPVTIGIFITPGQRGDTFPDEIGTGNPDNRDREYDVLNDDYARFLVEEMLPEVSKKYALTQDPAGRAIGGSSSGGICAFTVAWERHDQFRNVISTIGSFTNIHGGHVYPNLVRAAEKKPIRVFLQDGVNDNRSPDNLERDWHIQNQKMVAALQEKGYDMAHVFGTGAHSDDHGGAILPQMLRWIWRDYPGVVPPSNDLVAEAAAIAPESKDLFPGLDTTAELDPSGTYHWESRFGNTTSKFEIKLEARDGKVTGELSTQRGEEPATTAALLNPVMQGNKLVFDVTSKFRDREISSTYQGVVSEQGIEGWRLMSLGGQARDSAWSAERERVEGLLKKTNKVESWLFELHADGQGSVTVEDDAIVFETTKLSSENWHVQAYQAGIELKEGTEYELTFSAKSPTNSTVLVMGIINQEDWHGIGLQEEIYAGKEYREFRIRFTAQDVVEKNNRIGFVLGTDLGKVMIKGLSLFAK